nr:histidine phosphatase family protein [Streptomyces sp. SID8379]
MSMAVREARFDGEVAPDDAALAAAARAAARVPPAARALTAPGRGCRRTALALGLTADVAPELAPWGMGRWSGRTLADVGAAAPDAVAAWLADAAAAPHGGESLNALLDRCGRWLERLDGEGRLVVVADPAAVRAVVVRALQLPAQAFWRLDVEPLTATELSGRSGRWNVRLGQRLQGS